MGAGVTGDLRPYRLRGSFVSLLLWEGRCLLRCRSGRALVATLAKHYAGCSGARGQAADACGGGVREARERTEVCDGVCDTQKRRSEPCCESPANDVWTMLGSNQRPPPCRDGALPAELIVREELNVSGVGCRGRLAGEMRWRVAALIALFGVAVIPGVADAARPRATTTVHVSVRPGSGSPATHFVISFTAVQATGAVGGGTSTGSRRAHPGAADACRVPRPWRHRRSPAPPFT